MTNRPCATNRAAARAVRRLATAVTAAIAVLAASLAAVGQPATAQDPPVRDAAANVNCDYERTEADVTALLEYVTGARTDGGLCPLSAPDEQINASAGDINDDGMTDLTDALLIAQCNAGQVLSVCEEAVPSPVEGDASTIRSNADGLCFAVTGAATEPGATVELAQCSQPTEPHQQWLPIEVDPGVFEFRVAHTGFCLSIDGDFAGASAVQWPCEANPAQRFRLLDSPAADGAVALQALHTGGCLHANSPQSVLDQQVCDESLSQAMTIDAPLGPVDERSLIGFWGPVISTPLVPAAGSNLPDGRVLLWSGYASGNFSGGGFGFTETAIFDPSTATSSSRRVSNTGHEMFCPGIANLADGRILVNGGSNNAETSIYDPATDQWIDADDMNVPRGYQGTTLLSTGQAFTLGGSWTGGLAGKVGELYDDVNGWQRRDNISADPMVTNDTKGVYRADNHLWLFAWENGRVFHAGPSNNMHWIDTQNNGGSISPAGGRGNIDAMNGNAVMFEPGKILAVGGAPDYSDSNAFGDAYVIDINSGTPQTRQIDSLNTRRALHTSTVLPSGEVVVAGGQQYTRLFTDFQATLTAEMFDPVTETFTDLAAMDVARTYHSMGLLLTDGRVLMGGGGLLANCGCNHFDVQIFTPPYLFADDGTLAPRPQIESAPSQTSWNQTMSVTTDVDVDQFVFVRMSSATHSVNNDQRRVPLSFSGDAGSYQVEAPTSSGVAPPGVYMLFAIDGDGVPSVAASVTLN